MPEGWYVRLSLALLPGKLRFLLDVNSMAIHDHHIPFATIHSKSPHAPGTAHGRLFPPIQGFPDIARQSFGQSGCLVLSILLYFELFSCVCIFFVAIGDHLHSIFPTVLQETHVIAAASISLVPTIFLHTPRLLSYFSMVGAFATVAVVATVVLAALTQGSQVNKMMEQTHAPSEQEAYQAWGDLRGWILCLGLVAYCFSGHAIVPCILY